MMWILLLVSHTGWFIKGLNAGSDAFSLSLLGLTLVLFLLKSIDVPFLRVQWTKQRMMAAIVIVLLLHVGVISDTVDADAFAWILEHDVSFLRLSLILTLAALALRLASQTSTNARSLHTLQWSAISACRKIERLCTLSASPLRGPPTA